MKTMTGKVTLSDIAKAAGVAVGTVHKALNDQKGVKSEKRAEIKALAEEMGYRERTNQLKEKNVLALFPSPQKEDSYFYQYIWKGIDKRASELSGKGLNIIRETFDGTIEDQLAKLEKLLEEKRDILDGLVTIIWDENRFLDIIEKYAESGIKVFTVSADAPFSRRFASVIINHYRTGKLAAEYLGSVINGSGKVIITGTRRDIGSHSQIVRGFFNQMSMSNPDIQIIELYETKSHPEKLVETLSDFLSGFPDIKGIYINNARTTALIGSFLSHSKYKNQLKIVGSELFKESVNLMKQEVFCALIDQQPFKQGYEGIELAYETLVLESKIDTMNYIDNNLYLLNNLPSDREL